ncbi:outer membrane beta-barrel protein [Pedobacter vanadiisoli]|uniref:Outer membrane beta-barrel protein n=1 Tax=Pedobacter vanadiisoli TaxID=1761975 RepID=A0ABW5MFG4_9SPHI
MMKIKLMLLSCLTIGQIVCYAQSKSALSLNVGTSIPLNDFASTDRNNELAGYAKTGFSIAVNYDYKLIKSFGIQAMIKLDNNDFSEADIKKLIDSQTGGNWNVNAKNWNSTAFLAGIYYAIPISDKAEFTIRGLAGATNVKEPETSWTTTVNNQNFYINKAEKSAMAFTYLLGIGLKCNIKNNLIFLANADYSDAKAEFNDVVYASNFSTIQPSTSKTKITKANISLGLGYKF